MTASERRSLEVESPKPGAVRPPHLEVAAQRERMQLIIADGDCRVLHDSIDPAQHAVSSLLSHDRLRFRGDVLGLVRSLIEQCAETGAGPSHIAFLDPQQFLRVTRLDGREGMLFAVTVEFFRAADSLSRAARKYGLTPREVDVLAMVLEGANTMETAAALNIAETTVQSYHKRLLSKTRSRNRSAMIANVLDWRGSGRTYAPRGRAR